jgi:hypothetical protein
MKPLPIELRDTLRVLGDILLDGSDLENNDPVAGVACDVFVAQFSDVASLRFPTQDAGALPEWEV